MGIVSEQDPVLMCHAISDVAESVETAFQLLDKKPTILIEADGNVVLPASLDYKYATSGNTLTAKATGKGTRVQFDGINQTWQEFPEPLTHRLVRAKIKPAKLSQNWGPALLRRLSSFQIKRRPVRARHIGHAFAP